MPTVAYGGMWLLRYDVKCERAHHDVRAKYIYMDARSIVFQSTFAGLPMHNDGLSAGCTTYLDPRGQVP